MSWLLRETKELFTRLFPSENTGRLYRSASLAVRGGQVTGFWKKRRLSLLGLAHKASCAVFSVLSLSLSLLMCCPDAEDPVNGFEALEGNRATSWKKPGSLNDCVKQSFLTNLHCSMTGVRNKLLLFSFVVLVASLPWLMHCGIGVFLPLLGASSLFSSLNPHLSLIA